MANAEQDDPKSAPAVDASVRSLNGHHHIAVVVALLLVHAGLLAWSAYVHSPTLNEPGHLVAGISHWEFGRFELYRVNPPLVRMVAALPVLAVGAETDWNSFQESPGARPAFSMGERFVALNGERSFWLFTMARWACIPFSLLGGYICYRWALELYGVSAGLIALTLWCFSPNILAHGSLITADVGAAALGVTAAYFFWRWLKLPTWSRALAAGATLGLAELAKTTWIILFVLWPLLWLLANLPRYLGERGVRPFAIGAGQLTIILLLGLYVLNLGYGFEGTATRLNDYRFVSEMMTANPDNDHTPGNRFADGLLASVPIPLPKNYLLGIDTQKKDLENYGFRSYLRGEFCETGWWHYYLYGLTVKVPLGAWALALLAGIAWLRQKSTIETLMDDLVLLAPAGVILVMVSWQNGFSHHFRYALPAFPFLFVAISRAALLNAPRRRPPRLAMIAIATFMASSLAIYPHSISFFNVWAGGPRLGHRFLLHSSLDWGQDLKGLKRWQERTKREIALAYYGLVDPHSLGVEYLQSDDLVPLKPGWYAISINTLMGVDEHYRGSFRNHAAILKSLCTYLRGCDPDELIGYSIYLFDLDASDLDNGKITQTELRK